MAKKSINRIQLPDDVAQSTTIFGIVSSEPAYKLSIQINQTLGNSLQSTEPVSVVYGVKATGFSRFIDKSDLPHSSISLIENRSEKQNLLRKFPNIDYILVRSTESSRKNEEEEMYSLQLRSIKDITAVFVIDKDKVDSVVLETIIPGY